MKPIYILTGLILSGPVTLSPRPAEAWQSEYISLNKDGSVSYKGDEKGNTLPDFSKVGYRTGIVPIPYVPAVKTIGPGPDAETEIQAAIDALSAKAAGKDGFRGALFLKAGTYNIEKSIRIKASGIVLRGEGAATRIVAKGSARRPLIEVTGSGDIREIKASRERVADPYVATGSDSLTLVSAAHFKSGDHIIIDYQSTPLWISRLKMDQIAERAGTKQWRAEDYRFKFERKIEKIKGNKLFLDNPVVLPIDPEYHRVTVYKYEFSGRISDIGIENITCLSDYTSDTAEDHSWDAVAFNKIENGWVRDVTARYFAFACVNLGPGARNITVTNCENSAPKSVITGGRRYAFNNNGQLNLFMNCRSSEGRHDYVTGAKVCGPNVFYNCTASRAHADIGPHHRWAMGTLYDNIITDGEINIQDRGNWGSGHGWAGVNQILWNCTARKAAVQSPWVSGKNYCIGLQGQKSPGRLPGRPDGEWEGQNKAGLAPASLYMAQLKARTGGKKP